MKTFNLQHRIGRTLQFDGKEYLYFSGTSYLGIDSVPEYEEILVKNIRKFGFNHGLSRVNNVCLRVFEDFEEYFARNAGADSAAVVSSGYLAGISAWQWLYPQADLCWIAPNTHPAILPAGLKPDFQLDFIQWKNRCLEQMEAIPSQRIFILGNAVDPLRAEIHSYDWVKEIAKRHEVTLLIDDSHAFGVLGKSVFGTLSEHVDPKIRLVISGSLGKGLAMPAGIILGERKVIEAIKSQAIFTGASPGSPANLQAFIEAKDIYTRQSQKIRDYSGIFHHETQDLSTLHGSAKFPVFRFENTAWPEQLEERGIIASSFSYPTSESPRINRIVISGFHTLSDLMYLNDSLHRIAHQR